jgi:septation ring formation regulator EzrA
MLTEKNYPFTIVRKNIEEIEVSLSEIREAQEALENLPHSTGVISPTSPDFYMAILQSFRELECSVAAVLMNFETAENFLPVIERDCRTTETALETLCKIKEVTENASAAVKKYFSAMEKNFSDIEEKFNAIEQKGKAVGKNINAIDGNPDEIKEYLEYCIKIHVKSREIKELFIEIHGIFLRNAETFLQIIEISRKIEETAEVIRECIKRIG